MPTFRPAADPAVRYLYGDDCPATLSAVRPSDRPMHDDRPPRLRLGELDRVGQGEGVTVAVLSTGVDDTHPALGNRVQSATDWTGTRRHECDVIGPGTAYAGVIVGQGGTSGPAGVAPRAAYYSLKVCGGTGVGLTSQLVSALRALKKMPPDIVLLGLTVDRMESRVIDELHRLYMAGVTIIAPAGNATLEDSHQCWPSKAGAVIGVGATDTAGRPLIQSCRGEDIEVAAWGGPRVVAWPGNRLALIAGTGIAAALVAGVCALIVEQRRAAGLETDPGSISRELAEYCVMPDPPAPESAVGLGVLQPGLLIDRYAGELRDEPPAAAESDAEYLQRIEIEGLAADHARNGPDGRID